MKKSKLLVLLCAVMTIAMVISAVVVPVMASEGNFYTDSFNYDSFADMAQDGMWSLETVRKTDTETPALDNGALKMTKKNSVSFNWTEFIPVSRYSAEDENTFEFDMKITDFGTSGEYWGNSAHTGALYVGFGGYYNLLRTNQKDGTLYVGGSKTSSKDILNKDVHVKIEWCGTSIYTVMTDSAGNKILDGTRTNDSYTVMNNTSISDQKRSTAMTYLVLRCESGAVEIDNFSFNVFPVELEEFKIKTSITLDSQIRYNVYIPASDELKSFTLEGKEYSDLLSTANNIVNVDGADYYCVSISLPAAEAARSINLRVTLEKYENDFVGSWSLNIPKYAQKVIANGNDIENQLAKDVLAYVKAAYNYFAELNEQEEILRVNALIESIIGDYAGTPTSSGTTDTTAPVVAVTLNLDAKPSIRFYVTDTSVGFYADGRKLNTVSGTDANGTYVELDVYAYALCETITYAEGGSYHISDFLAGAEGETHEALVKAFVKYTESAAAYRESVVASGN